MKIKNIEIRNHQISKHAQARFEITYEICFLIMHTIILNMSATMMLNNKTLNEEHHVTFLLTDVMQ